MTTPTSWNEPPGTARERWHTEARERDEAYVAGLPHDDSESPDSPWRAPDAADEGRREAAHYQEMYEAQVLGPDDWDGGQG